MRAERGAGWEGFLSELGFGVITTLQFSLRRMSVFDLLVILVLLVGGIGLFLSSLKDQDRKNSRIWLVPGRGGQFAAGWPSAVLGSSPELLSSAESVCSGAAIDKIWNVSRSTGV